VSFRVFWALKCLFCKASFVLSKTHFSTGVDLNKLHWLESRQQLCTAQTWSTARCYGDHIVCKKMICLISVDQKLLKSVISIFNNKFKCAVGIWEVHMHPLHTLCYAYGQTRHLLIASPTCKELRQEDDTPADVIAGSMIKTFITTAYRTPRSSTTKHAIFRPRKPRREGRRAARLRDTSTRTTSRRNSAKSRPRLHRAPSKATTQRLVLQHTNSLATPLQLKVELWNCSYRGPN